jgi:hypothetical protein
MSIDVMKQALEALIDLTNEMSDQDFVNQGMDAIPALRLAIEQAERECCCGEPDAPGVVHRTDGPCYMAERQEPVAWMQGTGLYWPDDAAIGEPDCEPLYTAPPQREKQEPCGRLVSDPYDGHRFIPRIKDDWSMLGLDLYTAPPQRQPLTEWRLVSESKPPEDVAVWLYEKDRGAWIGTFSYPDAEGWCFTRCYAMPYMSTEGGWDCVDAEWDDDYAPTHWMPLPAAPAHGIGGEHD